MHELLIYNRYRLVARLVIGRRGRGVGAEGYSFCAFPCWYDSSKFSECKVRGSTLEQKIFTQMAKLLSPENVVLVNIVVLQKTGYMGHK